MAEPQKRGSKYYSVARSFILTDKKTGKYVVIAPGERIPQKALDDDEVFGRLLKERKVCETTKKGMRLESADDQVLTQQQIKELIEKPDVLYNTLRQIRFTQDSLLKLRAQAQLAKLPAKDMAEIDRALER